MGGTTLRAGILDYKRDRAKSWHSALSVSWLWLHHGQMPQAQATMVSPPDRRMYPWTVKQNRPILPSVPFSRSGVSRDNEVFDLSLSLLTLSFSFIFGVWRHGLLPYPPECWDFRWIPWQAYISFLLAINVPFYVYLSFKINFKQEKDLYTVLCTISNVGQEYT